MVTGTVRIRSMRQHVVIALCSSRIALCPSRVALLAALITLFSVLGLAVAVQNQLVGGTSGSRMPARIHRWLWRIETVARLAVLTSTGAGIVVCFVALRDGQAEQSDFKALAGLGTVLFIVLIGHAMARLVLPRLWSPASEAHLAPKLSVDETGWILGLVLVLPLALPSVAYLIYGFVVEGLALIVSAAIMFAFYLFLRRASLRSTARSREKRDDGLEAARLRRVECQLTLEGLHVETAIFRDKNGTFIDPDRASELANDVASTRLFLEERGVDPASLLQIRNRLLPPRLIVSKPSDSDRESRKAKARLVKVALGPKPSSRFRREPKTKLYRLTANVLELLQPFRPSSRSIIWQRGVAIIAPDPRNEPTSSYEQSGERRGGLL